jgi:CRISPR/Cas system-associated exonuclease Cas4 (RecB family)
MVQTKGGAVHFCPKRIWITSNKAPEQWYKNCDFSAMQRRLTGDLGVVEYVGPPVDMFLLGAQKVMDSRRYLDDKVVGEKRGFVDLREATDVLPRDRISEDNWYPGVESQIGSVYDSDVEGV